jgi:NAD+ synthase (glutamine-hydrolysing)
MTATHPLKLTLIVPEMKVADVHFNLAQMLKALPEVASASNPLVVFPELSLTGKTCGDLFFQPTLIDATRGALDKLIGVCSEKGIWMIAGLPLAINYHLLNSAAFISPNGLQAFVVEKNPKASQFSNLEQSGASLINFAGKSVPIGVELSFHLPELTDRTLQIVVGNPEQATLSESTQLLINLRTHPAIAEPDLLPAWYVRFGCRRPDLLIATCSGGPTESTTDWIASGKAQILANHHVLAETTPLQFTSQSCDFFIDSQDRFPWEEASVADAAPRLRQTPFIRDTQSESQFREVLEIQAAALMGRLRHTGLKRVVFGNSGGADSSMVLLVCVRAFECLGYPREDILAVSMPGPGSSVESKNRSMALAKAAGVGIKAVPIGPAIAQHLGDIGHPIGVHDTTFENAQARERTQILMDLANQQNALMVGTGDLSESALGFATFNGDHMSMYNVNAGLPKTLLLRVLAWAGGELLGEEGARVAATIASATISPELVPSDIEHPVQSTEAILGPYLLHDFFLWHAIGQKARPSEVFSLACEVFKGDFTRAEILRVLNIFYRRFFSNQFKRNACADGPQVVPISLSPRGGFEMPSDASSDLWLAELEQLNG